ncbi:MAG: hypothetical protein Kow00133_05130 [Amphiplicatus sp.]
MPVNPDARIEAIALNWVPDFARGLVRDLRCTDNLAVWLARCEAAAA